MIILLDDLPIVDSLVQESKHRGYSVDVLTPKDGLFFSPIIESKADVKILPKKWILGDSLWSRYWDLKLSTLGVRTWSTNENLDTSTLAGVVDYISPDLPFRILDEAEYSETRLKYFDSMKLKEYVGRKVQDPKTLLVLDKKDKSIFIEEILDVLPEDFWGSFSFIEINPKAKTHVQKLVSALSNQLEYTNPITFSSKIKFELEDQNFIKTAYIRTGSKFEVNKRLGFKIREASRTLGDYDA